MTDYKSEIIFTFHECDKAAFVNIHDQLAEQLARYKDIEFGTPRKNEGSIQFGVFFDYDCKIPTICIKKTQINDYITVSIFENSFISLLILRDNIIKQFGSAAQDDLSTIDFMLDKDENILTFCFREFVPSFKLYDKGDKS